MNLTHKNKHCMTREKSEVLTKITTVLESYDEVAIIEAIEKNHFLDLKNLSEADVEKTVMFFMENVKDRVKTLGTPQIIFDKQNEHLLRMCRSCGMTYFLSLSAIPESDHLAKIKKQPCYRKFEKKRF